MNISKKQDTHYSLAEIRVDILSSGFFSAQQWDTFIESSPQGALYALHGYASAVAADWQAAVVSKGERWLAVMPFVARQKLGLKYSLQPLFCQYWGVFFAPLEGTAYAQLSQQRKCLEALLPVLQPFRLMKHRLSPHFPDLLPFHWDQFSLHPRFTYTLDIQRRKEDLWAALAPPLRRQIKKGEKLNLQFKETDNPQALLGLIARQHAAGHDVLKGAKNGLILLQEVMNYLKTSGKGKLGIIENEEGHVLAAGLFGYFNATALYLIGSYDPEHRDTGAMSQLMWQAIGKAKEKKCQTFDFEGSMIASIEGFFRKFGTRPQTYFEISKNTLPLPLRWMEK